VGICRYATKQAEEEPLKFKKVPLSIIAALAVFSGLNQATANEAKKASETDPFWKNAVVYFMMTDRFNNADPTNDDVLGRKKDGAVLRNFMGGDIKGVTEKINEGYFDALGVDAIWTTPLVEQVHGPWDESWGRSYSFHGYWPKDWTAIDPSFGSETDMREMIEAAHKRGIRILGDVILNHTGPKTPKDEAWPADWIRTRPICKWHNYENNVKCALAESLTDIKTESDAEVELSPFLIEKWRSEGRLDTELAELDAFFARTKLPRAPKYYIIKWLTDWVRDYGIDGFRVDTAKHIEAEIWQVLKDEASLALKEWKAKNPSLKIDDKDFFMMGEVYEYGLKGYRNTVKGGRAYNYGDKHVDFFNHGFDALINMGFASHATESMEQIFSDYSHELYDGPLKGVGVINYIASHDDGAPYDKSRSDPYEAALKLMLAPGAVQIYYGDELARDLTIEGAFGDATLRSFMNWGDLETDKTQELLKHWQKLGNFRKAHHSLGAGTHKMLQEQPYMFSRTLEYSGGKDRVLVAVDIDENIDAVSVYGVFPEGTSLKDYYSGQRVTVENGHISVPEGASILLLGQAGSAGH